MKPLQLKLAKSKFYIGPAAKGFDFLGYRSGEGLPNAITISQAMVQRFFQRLQRLYEQRASTDNLSDLISVDLLIGIYDGAGIVNFLCLLGGMKMVRFKAFSVFFDGTTSAFQRFAVNNPVLSEIIGVSAIMLSRGAVSAVWASFSRYFKRSAASRNSTAVLQCLCYHYGRLYQLESSPNASSVKYIV